MPAHDSSIRRPANSAVRTLIRKSLRSGAIIFDTGGKPACSTTRFAHSSKTPWVRSRTLIRRGLRPYPSKAASSTSPQAAARRPRRSSPGCGRESRTPRQPHAVWYIACPCASRGASVRERSEMGRESRKGTVPGEAGGEGLPWCPGAAPLAMVRTQWENHRREKPWRSRPP